MKQICILLIVLIGVNGLFAQNNNQAALTDDKTKSVREVLEPKITFELDLRAATTLGDFKERYPDEGMGGFGATILVPVSKKFPLDFGVDAGLYFMSGTESYTPNEKLELEKNEYKTTVIGTMVPFHLVCRGYPLKHTQSRVQPYAEALFGGKMFAVEETTEFELDDSKVKAISKKESSVNSSMSYGFGVGVKSRISKNNLLYVNFKLNQLFGDEVKYIDATKAKLDKDGNYESEYHYSKTDIFQIGIGLHLMIE